MKFSQLFLRDCFYYRKPFVAISAASCLICAILTSAMLIGDSVRGTLYDNLNRNTEFVKIRLRLAIPVNAEISGSVLHTQGFIAPGIKTEVYAFPHETQIKGRDAFCSGALSETLNLKIGETFVVNVQTIAAIKSENLMGMPPKLKQIQFVFRGVWEDEKADVNFENPQLRANNLFVDHKFLSEILALEDSGVNEIWLNTEANNPTLDDEVLWSLSQLYFDDWNGRPVLKCKAFFIPDNVAQMFPNANRGLTTFAESLSNGKSMNYFFIGAYDGDVFPVEKGRAILSDSLEEDFPNGATLTYFTTDAFRKINNATHFFPQISKAPNSQITAVLSPEIPGLTDASDCSDWEAGLPVDFNKISDADEVYWEQYKSKPKLYMNFAQAQEMFFPEKCTALVFAAETDTAEIQKKIVAQLHRDATLIQSDVVAETLKANIDAGIPFAPLFLGLSFFIIISAILVLATMLKLHFFDRKGEFEVLAMHTDGSRKFAIFHLVEMMIVLLPGILLGLMLGTLLCRFQLLLLEHVWNGIILMNRLNFHAAASTYFTAFAFTLLCSLVVVVFSLRLKNGMERFKLPNSKMLKSFFALATLSFFRRLGQYKICMVLLILGFLGTLGVGAFGIKNRGEDAFLYEYIAETVLPVIPSHEEPFPPDAIAVRVYDADSADCSNILRAATPTVYGCDVRKLTGDPDFLHDYSAAVDAGSMEWIIKKKIGDSVQYPNGSIKLQRTMKATVFQRGILVDNSTFEKMFPEIQGANFFLIRNAKNVEVWRKYLEPFGVTLTPTDAFMAKAESFQNRYLAIFLQLGILGFVLGIGSLLLLMLRNLHARRDEIVFLSELGFSRNNLFICYYVENLWLYLASASVSLILLILLALVAGIHFPTLIIGWSLLVCLGISLIFVTLRIFFNGFEQGSGSQIIP